jgi:hypothetical protein
MDDFIFILFHSRRSRSKNDQIEFGHNQKHNQRFAYKILFLHHDICSIEMNGGRSHHGSLWYLDNMNLIKSQLPILVLVLIILILASHFPSLAQGIVVVVELQLKVLLQHKNNNFKTLDAKNNCIDPLNHFQKYKDGCDFKSKHYWEVCEQDPTCLL